ncbi:MAG: GDSL-type esterase/lipase family protein [Pirellulales bacterium]
MFAGQPPIITDAAPYSAAFTKAVFMDTLGRTADPGAQAWFVQQLDAGASTASVAPMLTNSTEYEVHLVQAAYQQYLGRDAEPAALAFWVNAVRTHIRDEQLAAALVASDEFYSHAGGTNAAWVAAAYQAVLGRAATASDIQWATGLLASGVSRAALASDLAYSTEHEQQTVVSEFTRYLHAAPNSTDLNYWATQLTTGQQTAESLVAELTGTNGYYEQHTGVPLSVVPVPFESPAWSAMNAQIENNAAHTNPDVVFLGDSITQLWEQDGAAVWQQNYAGLNALDAGISGDRTQNLLWRIENGDLNGISPQVAVVMIGVNNIMLGDDAQSVAEGITSVVDELHVRLPNTTILLLGILPAQPPVPINAMPIIKEANHSISALANGRSILYLDMGPSFTNSDGSIDSALYQPELLHLNAAGYETWAEAMTFELSVVMASTESNPLWWRF